jgi:hypothetical protein
MSHESHRIHRRSHDTLSEFPDPPTGNTQMVDPDPDIVSKVPNRSLVLHINGQKALGIHAEIANLGIHGLCSRA